MNKTRLTIKVLPLALCMAGLSACVLLPEPTPARWPAGWRDPSETLAAAHRPGAVVARFSAGAFSPELGQWGWADIEARKPVEADTPFIIASVSKLVVGIAVMQLVEAGQLELDADVSDYLGFTLRNPAHPDKAISLRQLLTHRSGILNDWAWSMGLAMDSQDPAPREGCLGAFLQDYLRPGGRWYGLGHWAGWAPGQGFEYSNPGICLAAWIVERMSGQDFAEYTRTRIFESLGMLGSYWFLADGRVPPAIPYLHAGDAFVRKGYYNAAFYPAGFLKSTGPDLVRLGEWLLLTLALPDADASPSPVLSPGSLRAMLAPQDGPSPLHWQEQGLVWQIREIGGRRLVGHSGGLDGISSLFLLDPAAGVGALFLSNGGWLPQTPYDRLQEAPIRALMLELLASAP